MYAIEGGTNSSEEVIVLGARPVTDGYDMNFAGSISGAVFSPSRAPSMFSRCILECLESVTVDTAGTTVSAELFDVSSRQLVLRGPASPSEIQQVLRTLVYTNRAPDLNTASMQLQVSTKWVYLCCLFFF